MMLHDGRQPIVVYQFGKLHLLIFAPDRLECVSMSLLLFIIINDVYIYIYIWLLSKDSCTYSTHYKH